MSVKRDSLYLDEAVPMMAALQITPTNGDNLNASFTWPDNLTINHPGPTSVQYPDTWTRNVQYVAGCLKSVAPSSQIVTQWSFIAPKMIREIEALSVDWAAVECFERRGRLGDMPVHETTVIVTVRRMPSITIALARLMETLHRISGCRVEIQLGDVQRQTGGILNIPYESCPPVGSKVSLSEGLSNVSETTAGGIVELVGKSGKVEKTCVLTCYHNLPSYKAIRPPDIDLEPGSPRIAVNRYGATRCAYPSQIMLSQCVSDVRDDRDAILKRISEMNGQIEELPTLRQLAPQNAELSVLSNIYDNICKSYDYMMDVDCNIGEVFATSGMHIRDDHHLDWALISLNDDRFFPGTVNMIPDMVTRSGKQTQLSTWSERISGGSKVYKVVHCNLTEGVVNPIPSCVRFKHGDKTVMKATEWAVVPNRDYKTFSDPGDSGAWVIDHLTNALIGVVLGGNNGLGVAYITPIKEIAQDIAKCTGYSVRLPHGMIIA